MTRACDKKRKIKRKVKERAQGRWVAANRRTYLACKRESAARPATLARRRHLYSEKKQRRDQGVHCVRNPQSVHSEYHGKPRTLDAWAKKDGAAVHCDSPSDVATNRY